MNIEDVCSGAWKHEEFDDERWANKLQQMAPFWMSYDTSFCNKEHYSEITELFENAYSRFLGNKERSLSVMTTFGMAVIDTMDAMSKEIFEHYKALERIAKEVIHGIIAMIKEENNNYQIIDAKNRDKAACLNLAKAAYVILKACRMKVVLAEKYQATGMDLLEIALGVVSDIQDERLKWTAMKDEVMVMVNMANEQKLMLESTI